jgi:hypothetical protein
MRAALIVIAGMGLWLSGCTYSADFDVAQAERLEGVWELRMQGTPAPPRSDTTEATGQVALVVNKALTRVDGFPGVPLTVGVHDLDLGDIAPGLGRREGVPGVAAGLRGDSVDLVIAPGSALPIRLRGLLGDDTVAGVWEAWRERVVLPSAGTFAMVRR